MDQLCIYCSDNLSKNEHLVFHNQAKMERFRAYIALRKNTFNPSKICFNCYDTHLNHRNAHEKTTIYLLNMKIIIVFLSVLGFFAVNDKVVKKSKNLNASLYSDIDDPSKEIYGTSQQEILRRKIEVDAKLMQLDSSNKSFVNSPFSSELVLK